MMIPKPRLKVDLYFGEGDVVFPEEWEDLEYVLKIDLLSDWIGQLQKKYDETMKAEEKVWKANRRKRKRLANHTNTDK